MTASLYPFSRGKLAAQNEHRSSGYLTRAGHRTTLTAQPTGGLGLNPSRRKRPLSVFFHKRVVCRQIVCSAPHPFLLVCLMLMRRACFVVVGKVDVTNRGDLSYWLKREIAFSYEVRECNLGREEGPKGSPSPNKQYAFWIGGDY
ncbi:hypothetical protein AVEN_6641-1 [Araneus ventricosus]|uniref:Uncharacterized protein n=1 Tax=Araneus ventricosus TaxID=182803 RepID=A0A4Y2H254_ARAVE|nr:hypothetical protein AVEN_6641-1 [Araneus ventricosus]